MVTINVSGHRYKCLLSSLQKHPDSLLGSCEKDFFYEAETEEYFFERDPILFRSILKYYQTGQLHYPRNECVQAFKDELEFFGIIPELLGNCCHEEYVDRSRDVMERFTSFTEMAEVDCFLSKSILNLLLLSLIHI